MPADLERAKEIAGKGLVTLAILVAIAVVSPVFHYAFGWADYRVGHLEGWAQCFAIVIRHPGFFGLAVRRVSEENPHGN